MNIRNLYLYLFSFIGLLIAIFGAVQLVDLALNTFVFPDADTYGDYPRFPGEYAEDLSAAEQAEYEERLAEFAEVEQRRNRQRQLSSSLSMLVVGIPLYLYHWRTITREKGKGDD
jgi:hypothetical protein